jgi:hypothetical protein
VLGLFALKLAREDIAEMRSPGMRHVVDDQQLAVGYRVVGRVLSSWGLDQQFRAELRVERRLGRAQPYRSRHQPPHKSGPGLREEPLGEPGFAAGVIELHPQRSS